MCAPCYTSRSNMGLCEDPMIESVKFSTYKDLNEHNARGSQAAKIPQLQRFGEGGVVRFWMAMGLIYCVSAAGACDSPL